MKNRLCVFLCMICVCCAFSVDALADYQDIENSKYCREIEELTQYGIITAKDNDLFEPDKLFTRADMAEAVVHLLGDIEYDINTVQAFDDLQTTHWAYDYLTQTSVRGIMLGDGENRIRPDDPITFAEMIKVCIYITGYEYEVTNECNNWYVPYIKKASELGISKDIELSANQTITREEAAKILYNTINVPIVEVHCFEDARGILRGEFVVCDGIQYELKTLLGQISEMD